MRKIRVQLAGTTSEIVVDPGVFQSIRGQLTSRGLTGPCLVVSQARLLTHLPSNPLKGFEVVIIPEGERAKSLKTVARVIDRMVSMKLPRDATIVAIGGGVVGDVAGFAASIYLRGIRVVQVPTTLLAQVDSSVGGKTGVNHLEGKNLIGTFHQPRLVLVDPHILRSLPSREYTSGLFEVVKYGVIRDAELFRIFENDLAGVLDRREALLVDLIGRSLSIKAEVVMADEKEGDLRRILNFGHTIGHGIEAAVGYRRVRHGEAVGYGMIGAASLARRLHLLPESSAQRIEAAVRSIGPLPDLRGVSVSQVLAAISHDKKVREGTVHFVLPTRIGRVRMVGDVPRSLLRDVVGSLL